MGMVVTPSRFTSGIGPVGSYVDEVLADSPIAYWKADEATGTVLADSSGNGLNGEYSTSSYLVRGVAALRVGGVAATKMTGQSWAARYNSSIVFPGAWTLELIASVAFGRINAQLLAPNGSVGTPGMPGLYVRNDGSYNGKYSTDYNQYNTRTIAYGLNVAKHLAMDSLGNIYVNGALSTATPYKPPITGTRPDMYMIGSRSYPDSYSPYGTASDFAIYGSALPARRILAHATAAGLTA